MELSDSSQGRVEKHDSTSAREALGENVALYLRLWSYGGPAQPLGAFTLDQDPDISRLIHGAFSEAKGLIIERKREMLTVYFQDAVQAIASAKDLQQRFLTFHRKTEPQQVVPSILIAALKKSQAPGTEASQAQITTGTVLAIGTSAQILVSEAIYERVKNVPGLRFNPTPARESGGTGGPEAIYELLWTDESTYGHLRQASGNTGFRKVGRYEIQEELGRGAMGVVYKAYDRLIGRTIALKTIEINRNTPDRDDLIERLKQEAKAAGGLDHPNIITIYDVGQEDDLVYLSMQFIEGRTLLSVLAEPTLPPIPAMISYAEQILSAVGFAHARGVIHRDLKPANLMLTTQGIVKVLDFGIAKVENASLTQTGLVVGTPSHMAPEQVAGKKVDHRADIFALGSVFYEMVTHEKPFRGDVTTILYKIMHEDPVAPALINPALPGGIDAIIRKALAKDPSERFQSCEEMREAFLAEAAQLESSPSAAATISASAPKAGMVKAVASKPANRTGSYPHYLLEEAAPKKPNYIWLNLVIIALLGTMGITVWAYYTRASTGSFPPVIAKVVGALHQSRPQGSPDLKPEESAVPPQPDANPADTGSTSSATANTASPVKTGSDNPPTVPQPSASSASPAQPSSATASPNPLSGDKSQPAADSGQASALNTPPMAGEQQQSTTKASANSNQILDKNQPAGTSNAATTAVNQSKSLSISGSDENAVSQEPPKPVKKALPQAPATVDGFSRRDIPELLRQADAAAGRNDYRLARYEYSLILKLDPTNPAAKAAIRRIP